MKVEIDNMATSMEILEVQVEKLEHQLDLTNAEKNLIAKQLWDQEKRTDTILHQQESIMKCQTEASSTIKEQDQKIEKMNTKINSLEDEIRKKASQGKHLKTKLADTCAQRDDAHHRLVTFDGRENKLYQQPCQRDRIRRGLHNKGMQLSGNIRVYDRVRPELPGEKVREAN